MFQARGCSACLALQNPSWYFCDQCGNDLRSKNKMSNREKKKSSKKRTKKKEASSNQSQAWYWGDQQLNLPATTTESKARSGNDNIHHSGYDDSDHSFQFRKLMEQEDGGDDLTSCKMRNNREIQSHPEVGVVWGTCLDMSSKKIGLSMSLLQAEICQTMECISQLETQITMHGKNSSFRFRLERQVNYLHVLQERHTLYEDKFKAMDHHKSQAQIIVNKVKQTAAQAKERRARRKKAAIIIESYYQKYAHKVHRHYHYHSLMVSKIQKIWRGKQGRRFACEKVKENYQRRWDPITETHYCYDTWTKRNSKGVPLICNMLGLALDDLIEAANSWCSSTNLMYDPITNEYFDVTEYKSRLRTKKKQHSAAASIQNMFRVHLARKNFADLVRSIYQKVFDEESQAHFYYNAKTGTSQWTAPLGITDLSLSPRDPAPLSPRETTLEVASSTVVKPLNEDEAAICIQKLFRVILARSKLRQLISSVYECFYDEESQTHFYYNAKTGTSQWTAPLGITDL